jgi:hypothetical protein
MVMAMAKQQASGWGGSERCVDGMVGGVFVGVCVCVPAQCVCGDMCRCVCAPLVNICRCVCAPARLCEYVCVWLFVFFVLHVVVLESVSPHHHSV